MLAHEMCQAMYCQLFTAQRLPCKDTTALGYCVGSISWFPPGKVCRALVVSETVGKRQDEDEQSKAVKLGTAAKVEGYSSP